MNNIELVDNNFAIDNYVHYSTPDEVTFTSDADYIVKHNRSAILKYFLSGAMLLNTSYADGSSDNFHLTDADIYEMIDSHLDSYNQSINMPINQYIKQINEISSFSKYSLKDIFREIISFKSLKDNWDGYGAIPSETESAANALLLVKLLGENSFKNNCELFPNPYGTISFIWHNGSNEKVSLEVGNNQMSYYVELNSMDTIFCNNIDIDAKEAKKLCDFIQVL